MDTRPDLARDLDGALEIGLFSLYRSLEDGEGDYASCMGERGYDVGRPSDFSASVEPLIADYRSAWDDAPVEGRDAGPSWILVREREISASIDDAACREELIGASWQQLADILDVYDREFADARATMLADWQELLGG